EPSVGMMDSQSVKSFFTTHFRRFDTLTIHHPNTWFGVASSLNPHLSTYHRIDTHQRPIITPYAVIIGDMIPRWELFWQHPPLTAGSRAIKERIQDFTDINR